MKTKKSKYSLVSPLATAFGLAVTGAASSNPVTAPVAAPLGTAATGILGGANLTDEEMSIKDKFDEAINKTWNQIYDDYKLTDICFSKLEQEVIGENTSTDEFINNSQRKKLEESYALAIQIILEKYKGGLERKSKKTWDNEYISNASKDIASRLLYTLNSVFEEDDLVKIIKAIADRSKDIRGDISKSREADRLEHEQLLQMLIEISESIKVLPASTTANFKNYYEIVKKRFQRNKKGADAELVGAYSDEESYIDADILVGGKRVSVLSYLEKWFCDDTFGTLLIHGEPGHGKTSLCRKAVFEHYKGNFVKNKAKNVLMVSLNIGDNPTIIDNGIVVLENALTFGSNKNHRFSFEDCRGALLFMDGFDEFIDEAKKTNIKDIVDFMKLINEIADEYDCHIVVLSRTIAVERYFSDPEIVRKNYGLLPLTRVQQENWLDKHTEYEDYKGIFYKLYSNKNMRGLFEIPFLFRLIVHSRFDESSTDVVELYSRLFSHLMDKRNIHGAELESVNTGLMNLAYTIYCDNTDTAAITEEDRDKRWIIAFYLKAFKKGRIGFYHRSFYQYFLAGYIYNGIFNLTEDQAETYISYFAEREVDDTVCQYLSLMFTEEEKETIYSHLKYVIDALVRTEAYLSFEPRCSSGNAEKKKIERSINIVHNTFKLCAVFDYVVRIPFKDNIDVFLRIYPCNGIKLCSYVNQRANLRGADLRGSDLRGADLRRTDLSGADLSGAILRDVNLSEANLRGAYLRGTDLRKANLSEADLSNADLRETNLRGASLSGVNLSRANLNEADLSYSDLSRANLSSANLEEASLGKANLSGADLSNTNLKKAVLNPLRANFMSIGYNYKQFINPYVNGYDEIQWR